MPFGQTVLFLLKSQCIVILLMVCKQIQWFDSFYFAILGRGKGQ